MVPAVRFPARVTGVAGTVRPAFADQRLREVLRQRHPLFRGAALEDTGVGQAVLRHQAEKLFSHVLFLVCDDEVFAVIVGDRFPEGLGLPRFRSVDVDFVDTGSGIFKGVLKAARYALS